MADAFIIDAVRTARGRRKGSLSETHPIDLLVAPLKAVVQRNDVDPGKVEDDRRLRHRDRRAGLQSGALDGAGGGWPVEVPGVTLNRFCSRQQAVNSPPWR
ncbi:MAG: hypothetical protein U0802_23815 [Candidatus Binatia bacterium]